MVGGVKNGWRCQEWLEVSRMVGGIKNGWRCQERLESLRWSILVCIVLIFAPGHSWVKRNE
jgi:hypothetical protein